MKIETQLKQQTQKLEQEQLIGYWIKSYGITKKDLDNHPQIDDLMLLIKFRAEFWDMNKTLKKKFDRSWDWVYNHRMSLKKNHLNNLSQIGKIILRWRNTRQEKTQLIQAFRQKHLGK
jgi:hypothetical protein